MPEGQNIEYKEIWKDEYLKVICAFANTDGGILYVGINDAGLNVGIDNSEWLLENLPNKIYATLGFFVGVSVVDDNERFIVLIEVDKQKHPVSYRGMFYVRSGSTTQEVKGYELQQFILSANG